MKFVAISDTHNRLADLKIPDADVLIHAGDATMQGRPHELEWFNEELGKLPHPIKIFVPGNHDKLAERDPGEAARILTNVTHYLVDELVSIEGISIYGSPWQPRFGYGWAFNANRGSDIRSKWDQIPTNTDILITHGPPFGVGDQVGLPPWVENAGCQDLLEAIQRIGIKYHVSGHIHEGYGARKVGETTYINASSVDERYEASNRPIVFYVEGESNETKNTDSDSQSDDSVVETSN